MELIVLMGIIVVTYCGLETFRELKIPLARCADAAFRVIRVTIVTAKTKTRDLIRRIFKPSYRLSRTYCIHTPWFLSSNQWRNTRSNCGGRAL